MSRSELDASDWGFSLRWSSPSLHAFAVASLLAVYVAGVHWASNYASITQLFFLRSPTAALQAAAKIVPIVYISLPALLLLAAMMTGSRRFIPVAWVLSLAAMVVSLVDLFVAPAAGAVGGTHAAAEIQLLIAITVCCWNFLIFKWAEQLRRAGPKSPLKMSLSHWIAIIPIVGLTLWSLSTGASAAYQASGIADGRPYCIATTTAAIPGQDYGPIRSLEELRGVRLYTWATGYKSTSSWYFHAVLIVGIEQPLQYWNWSISRSRFEPFVEPAGFHASVKQACQPVGSFLSRLPWF